MEYNKKYFDPTKGYGISMENMLKEGRAKSAA